MAESSPNLKQFVITGLADFCTIEPVQNRGPSRRTMEHAKRILLVEDDVGIANVLAMHLRDER